MDSGEGHGGPLRPRGGAAETHEVSRVEELGPASILMVDDHPANLFALEEILTPLGHTLVRAASGEEALKHLLVREFAVILLDVQMPGIDGFETAAMIKQRPKTREIPIVFITAIHREARHIFKGYEHGAVDYLLKPVDPDILRSKVSVFVELFQKSRKLQKQEELLRLRDREALEQRLERRFRALTDMLPLSLWASRPDGKAYYVNRSWREYSGLSGPALYELFNPELLHPDDRARVETGWKHALAHSEPMEVEMRLRRASDSTFRWHLARAVCETDDEGRLVGWVVTATDIDDRRKAEEARGQLLIAERKARAQAELANRTKDEFLATVSHELRTPLNAILGWARMLRSGLLESNKYERALETILRNAQVQKELIEDILDVSRIVTGKLRIQLRRISCIQIVQAALDTVRPAADAKGVAFVVEIDPTADHASGDPDRLQQVVWNLLSNAIKFTPKGGKVYVSLARQDSQVELVIRDTGKGISPEFLPHVFDRFRQEDGMTTRTQGGLGLGLAIVRHLVELHGGTVQATSGGEGQGASFAVRLPLRVIQVDEPASEWIAPGDTLATESPSKPEFRLEGVKVLFVDDMEDARELFSELMHLYGADVLTVGSAEKALDALTRGSFDVLVSDIGLPHEDGYALMRKVRSLPAEAGGRIPAIAVTGFARAEDGRRALEEGFQNHLAKPVEPFELMSLVASLTGRAV